MSGADQEEPSRSASRVALKTLGLACGLVAAYLGVRSILRLLGGGVVRPDGWTALMSAALFVAAACSYVLTRWELDGEERRTRRQLFAASMVVWGLLSGVWLVVWLVDLARC